MDRLLTWRVTLEPYRSCLLYAGHRAVRGPSAMGCVRLTGPPDPAAQVSTSQFLTVIARAEFGSVLYERLSNGGEGRHSGLVTAPSVAGQTKS